MNRTIPSLLHLFLQKLRMRIDLLRIREAYAGHPLPHSIRSLSDTLDELHVPNMVCRLEFGQLFEIEGPFVVKAGEEEYPFFLVELLDCERRVIVLRTVAGRHLEVPFDSFRTLWDGTVLLVEKSEETNETPAPVYWIRQGLAFLDRTWGYWLAGLCAALLSLVVLRLPDIADSRFLVKTAGVVVSLMAIIKASFDPHLVQRFCRLGKHSDCNAVFRSAGAKLFGWISLGELSLTYFVASLVWGVFVATNPASVFLGLDILALPFVGYSLIWQIRRRQWCTLCLAIDAILLADFGLELLLRNNMAIATRPFLLFDWLTFGVCFAIAVLSVRRIVATAETAAEYPRAKYAREHLLSDSDLFWQLLARQNEEPVRSDAASPTSNFVEAEHAITVVMNPSCPKCARVHRALRELEDYRIDLIFIVNEGDKVSYEAALRMISSGITNEWPQTDRIIGEWYDRRILPDWLGIHPLAVEDLREQMEYCRKIGITGTPTVLIDNRRLPDMYDVEDLKILL
ncbi:vitamin K epoxide reductase family protein [uncultured Alistipes sp.]|uniref:vitamin K epoxide reductase family protein n=1 Tax=uncultured Alistipes sp. TaxID=538949 RepID=UPI00266B5AD0|nr:vitamin K epoxide reductase family protein [uncultured Alistipes sp.]